MKKPFKIILALTVFLAFNGQAQRYETRLDYFPPKRENVTEFEYSKGIFFLERVYETIKKENLYISYADHLNIGIAFKYLKEPKKHILYEIELAQENNLYKTAEIFVTFYNTPEHFSLTQSEFDSLMQRFQIIYENGKKEKGEIDIAKYASENDLDENLLKLLDEIKKRTKSIGQKELMII